MAVNPVGIPAIVFGILSLVSAIILLRVGPSRLRNRLLAGAYISSAINLGVWFGAGVMGVSRGAFETMMLFAGPLGLFWPTFYLALVATLDTPWAKPMRTLPFRIFLIAQLLAIQIGVIFFSEHFIPIQEIDGGGYHVGLGPGLVLYEQFAAVMFLYTLVVAVSAYRRAKPGPSRRRAQAFAIAFGVRDATFGLWALVLVPSLGSAPTGGSQLVLYHLVPPITELVAQSILAYGVLQAQLFDIDLKLKRGISTGSVAAFFVVIYVIVSQMADRVLTPELGPVMGLVAAGALVTAIVPIQKAAQRLAARLFPQAQESDAYLTEKKLEVYRAALEEAHASDGGPSPADERNLARLRHALSLSDRDHAVLLYAVRTTRGGPARREDPIRPGETVLGRFLVTRALGEGSFARTYLARDDGLRRDVVLKVLRGGSSDAVLEEARAMARVRHPNVIAVHDADRMGEQAFIVMEHAENGALKERLNEGPLDEPEFARVADGLLAGLEAVHEAGMVHRDVKPANVLLTAKGEVKLSDFGIAHIPGFETTIGGGADAPVGTLRYMSPEQARGRRITPKTDLYAAAVTLFEARAGRAYVTPLPGESAAELQRRVARGIEYPEAGVGDARLDAWFRRGVAASPDDRFASATEMRDALRAALVAIV